MKPKSKTDGMSARLFPYSLGSLHYVIFVGGGYTTSCTQGICFTFPA